MAASGDLRPGVGVGKADVSEAQEALPCVSQGEWEPGRSYYD